MPVARRRSLSRRRGKDQAGWLGWLSKRPPWALSLAAHSALLLVLALATFATFTEPPLFLTAAIAEEDAWSEMPTATLVADLDTLTPEEMQLPELDSLVEPIESEFQIDTVADISPVSFAGDLLAVNAEALIAELSGGDQGSGESQSGSEATQAKPAGKPGRVSFFGSESAADRVAFVVDNSGSMQRGRMETTLMELDRSVKRLSESQSFYVVFFSDQAYPMFYPHPVNELLPATRENKRKLSRWLPKVEICLGGRLLDAVEMAAALEPQVVYLLSDGDIRSQRIMSQLTEPDAWSFTIHTLGMAARNRQHSENLAAIAQANGGEFRPVFAHPAAVRSSVAKPIPYHREPGATWGSLVQPWK